jgi:membrane protein YdbS with pleckstrin-like domain
MTQSATPITPAPDDRPHKPADDSEEVYFEGSPLLRAELGQVILFGIGGVVLLALAITNLVHWKYDWPWWVYLAMILIAAGLTFWPMMMRKTVRYRITNYRIDLTSGVLSRNVDTVELWHVEDLRLHQSLINRMVGVGAITIMVHDQALPKFTLRGLPQPQELFKMLEQRVIAVKRQRGVMKVDAG